MPRSDGQRESRRPLARARRVRWALVAVAACAAATSSPAPALAAGVVKVTVDTTDRTFSRDLPAAVVTDGYDLDQRTTFMSSSGTARPASSLQGASARRIAQLAGVDPSSLAEGAPMTFAIVDRARPVALSRGEVLDGFSGDPDGAGGQALVQVQKYGFDFVRPQRGVGDDNGDDELDTATNGDLAVQLRVDGDVLDVDQPGATPSSVQAGTPVSFTTPAARRDGAVQDDGLTYRWEFGDGSTSAQSAPTHEYAKGVWHARVTVSDGAGAGVSPAVTVSVGQPTGGDPTSTTTATTPTPGDGGSSAGPSPAAGVGTAAAGDGGATEPTAGTPGGATAPRAAGHGPAPSAHAVTPREQDVAPPPARRTRPAGRAAASAALSASGAVASQSAATPSAAAGSAPALGAGTPPRSHAPSATASHARHPAPTGARPTTERGSLVGLLVSAPGVATAVPAAAAPAPSHVVARTGHGTSAGGWAAWLLGAAALAAVVAFGAVWELDPRARYRSLATS